MPASAPAHRCSHTAARGGQPLDGATRTLLERAFGTDLGAVRVRTGAEADRLARGLRADAVASGADVYFRAGAYDPGTDRGLLLLAHEVAHVVQQSGGRACAGDARGRRRLLEVEADVAAADVLAGRRVRRTAGIDAVRPPAPGRAAAVQRHDSFEHRSLGDMSTDDIYAVASRASTRDKILQQQAALMYLWHTDPEKVTAEDVHKACPGIRVVTLQPSGLIATYGELNALPDYIANAVAIDSLPTGVLLALLQTIRQECYNTYNKLAGEPTEVAFQDAAFKPNRWGITLVDKIFDSLDMDQLTRALGVKGTDHYTALLARNACHFVPFAWHRWQSSYLMARNYATLAYETNDNDERDRLTYLAWTYHGYADHFLQDSFAAGHLVNKNLVMQWWIDWNVDGNTLLPVANWEFIKGMTTALQPNLAGRHLYDPGYQGPSNDPQTVEEQVTYGARLALSGVEPHDLGEEVAYQRYLAFLSSMVTQATSAALHDYYNANSLYVASVAQPTAYEIWGDDTLFTGKNAGPGARNTSETAQLSQESILELLAKGETSITTEQLRQRFPTRVQDSGGSLVDIETWQDGLKSWVIDKFFSGLGFIGQRLALQLSPTIWNLSRDQNFSPKWYRGLGGTLDYVPVATLMVGERLFAGIANTLYELDPQTGDVLQSLLLVKAAVTPVSLDSDGVRVFVGSAGRVSVVNIGSFELEWNLVVSGIDKTPAAVLHLDDRVYAASGGTIVQIDADTGTRLATVSIGAPGTGESHLATDGTLVFAGYDGFVAAINPLAAAAPVWIMPTTSGAVNLLANAGNLYAASNGTVFEFEPKTGVILHALKLATPIPTQDYRTRLASDGTRLFAGCHGYVYGIELDDWSTYAWDTGVSGTLWEAVEPLYDPGQGQLYAASNGYVMRFDPATGTKLMDIQLTNKVGVGDYTPSLALSTEWGLFSGFHGYVYGITVFYQSGADRDLLCYASSDGEARFYETVEGAVHNFGPQSTWSKNWTAAVPGHYQGARGFTDVALYAGSSDLLRLYACEGNGVLTALATHAQDKKWTVLLAGGFGSGSGYSDLCLYSSGDGTGRFYSTDGEGKLTQLGSDHQWKTTWTHIVTGTFGGGTALDDLLFYDSASGTAKFFGEVGEGVGSQIGATQSWKKGWTHVVVADFGGGTGYSDLCLYDAATGAVEFWSLSAPGKLELMSGGTWSKGFTHVVPGHFGGDNRSNDLSLYDGSSGSVLFYAVDAGKLREFGSATLPAGLTIITAGQFRGVMPG